MKKTIFYPLKKNWKIEGDEEANRKDVCLLNSEILSEPAKNVPKKADAPRHNKEAFVRSDSDLSYEIAEARKLFCFFE